ncbi:MAG TPA: sigma factor-like helix-turn-helix DNA-binding protein, partial [Thermoanaerobaculia bacterium]|nr:sigma factor-like helix-turn-helix DNA-binding protein [Thermoanaerobaculia bacterium]
DFLRSARSRERAHTATLHLVRSREENTAAETARAAEGGTASRLFERMSRRLTGKQKAAFVLREMEDLETSEIAAILNCGESTVRNHLFNARRLLRKELERIQPGLKGRPS